MVACSSNLVLFGGYGSFSVPIDPGITFVRDTRYSDNRGWTNELHIFDLNKGEGIASWCVFHVSMTGKMGVPALAS